MLCDTYPEIRAERDEEGGIISAELLESRRAEDGLSHRQWFDSYDEYRDADQDAYEDVNGIGAVAPDPTLELIFMAAIVLAIAYFSD